MFWFFDSYYILLVLPAVTFAVYAQMKVKRTFHKYKETGNRKNLTGAQTARKILDLHGLHEVSIQPVAGHLTDHYDPRTKVVSLSQDVYHSTSLSSVGVAAHEVGHAIQHANGYAPLVLRSTLVPVANMGSMFGPYMAIFGLIFGLPPLTSLGILFFAVAVAFYFITLPVEFNASTRAIGILESYNILEPQEIPIVKKVLSAAAMTYVASTLVAVANLLRLILLSRNRD
jgi:uncharacterized protein